MMEIFNDFLLMYVVCDIQVQVSCIPSSKCYQESIFKDFSTHIFHLLNFSNK